MRSVVLADEIQVVNIGRPGGGFERVVSANWNTEGSGAFDVTTTEWADQLCGGVFDAGPTRLDAAGERGIHQVVAPGCLDMVNFGAEDTVPATYKNDPSRKFYVWNPQVTLMRTTPEENARVVEALGEGVWGNPV